MVCFGELMMRLHAPSHQRFSQADSWTAYYGGSEANVAVLLARLGNACSLITRLPDNDLGDAAAEAVRKHGVDTSHILRGGDRLGLYFTETSNSIRPSRVIYDRRDSSFATLQVGDIPWDTIFSGAEWFHWSGISAAVSSSAADVCLEAVRAARKAGVKISADMNYRSTLWQFGKKPSDIMPELLSHCQVIAGDIDTAAVYFGIKPRSGSREESLTECGALLQQKLPAMELLAMTFRESDEAGTMTYSGVALTPNKLHFSSSYQFGNMVERIGSGDAFMGGLIDALVRGEAPARAIEFAVASGALKHSIPGEFSIVRRREIENFIHAGDAKGKIIR